MTEVSFETTKAASAAAPRADPHRGVAGVGRRLTHRRPGGDDESPLLGALPGEGDARAVALDERVGHRRETLLVPALEGDLAVVRAGADVQHGERAAARGLGGEQCAHALAVVGADRQPEGRRPARAHAERRHQAAVDVGGVVAVGVGDADGVEPRPLLPLGVEPDLSGAPVQKPKTPETFRNCSKSSTVS
jgi:hypothetical protein